MALLRRRVGRFGRFDRSIIAFFFLFFSSRCNVRPINGSSSMASYCLGTAAGFFHRDKKEDDADADDLPVEALEDPLSFVRFSSLNPPIVFVTFVSV